MAGTKTPLPHISHGEADDPLAIVIPSFLQNSAKITRYEIEVRITELYHAHAAVSISLHQFFQPSLIIVMHVSSFSLVECL